MTAGEAAKTENREQGINQQIHADRQANGGKLTGQEKKQINHEQNGASHQIYRRRHNNKVHLYRSSPSPKTALGAPSRCSRIAEAWDSRNRSPRRLC